jgi:hypothetical protein
VGVENNMLAGSPTDNSGHNVGRFIISFDDFVWDASLCEPGCDRARNAGCSPGRIGAVRLDEVSTEAQKSVARGVNLLIDSG